MPRIIDELERKINISVTLSTKTITRFDENIERLRSEFKALGIPEKDIKRTICRSGLIGEFVELLANPHGYAMIKSVIRLAVGVDYDQGELFDERK